MRVIALPVKSLDDAKTRLGPVLAPIERASLTLAMLEDVMDATQALVGWEASARRAETLAVLLPDTPLVTAEALTRALHTLGPVVLAPSADEGGTNLLIRRPPSAIGARFGPDSYRRHLQAAAEADLPASIVHRHELAFDLDLPGDILTVLDARRQGRTRDVCLDMDLGSRIATRA